MRNCALQIDTAHCRSFPLCRNVKSSRNSPRDIHVNSPKLCNLELFFFLSSTHPISFLFYTRTTTDIGKKFLSLPARQCECVLFHSFSTIYPVSKAFLFFSSEMNETCAIAQQQNNPGTKLPQHLFVYARDVWDPQLWKLCVRVTRQCSMC